MTEPAVEDYSRIGSAATKNNWLNYIDDTCPNINIRHDMRAHLSTQSKVLGKRRRNGNLSSQSDTKRITVRSRLELDLNETYSDNHAGSLGLYDELMTVPSTFTAFRIFKQNERIEGRLVRASLDELSDGEIVLKTDYSSINYKDALAATGAGKILRRFPLSRRH